MGESERAAGYPECDRFIKSSGHLITQLYSVCLIRFSIVLVWRDSFLLVENYVLFLRP